MSSKPLRYRTLHRALLVAGSVPRLARRLVVPEAVLKGWLAGEGVPPTGVFLRAVDVIESQHGFVERRRAPRHDRARAERGPWALQ
jgi:hypothetical protein